MSGIYSTRALTERGLTKKGIALSVHDRRLVRLRRGWYADETAEPLVAHAVARGGALTCVSAISAFGVWTLPHPDLHVRSAPGTQVSGGVGVRVHSSRTSVTHPVDRPETALAIAIGCLDLRAAVVVVDSVLNRAVIPELVVDRILSATPRGRRVLALCDGRAESGIETLPRLALRSRNLRVRTQVVIPQIGRVDLLIGERLILEVDGREWHSDFERDRSRDRELAARGYLVLRASYRQVMSEWPHIEEQILALVRRRDHLWRRTLPQGRRHPSSTDGARP